MRSGRRWCEDEMPKCQVIFAQTLRSISTMEDALEYHRKGRKGKIEVVPTKPFKTQRDLSLAYTPGVAEPCLAIQKDPEAALEYTARGNLVAVVTNGTAVLGLGNIGALAGKPVMEGKAVLFNVLPTSMSSIWKSTPRIRRTSYGSANCWSPPSGASTWKISRHPSVSTSSRHSGGSSRFGLPR